MRRLAGEEKTLISKRLFPMNHPLCFDPLCFDPLCFDKLCFDPLCFDTLCFDTLSKLAGEEKKSTIIPHESTISTLFFDRSHQTHRQPRVRKTLISKRMETMGHDDGLHSLIS